MMSVRLRFALIALLWVSSTAALFSPMSWRVPLILWLVGMLLLVGHFKYGTMLGVLQALGKGQMEQARNLLLAIKRPQWLTRRYQSYYHFAQGLITLFDYQQGDRPMPLLEQSKEAFVKSLLLGLSGKHEKSIVYLNLGNIHFIQGIYEEARRYLHLAQEQQSDDLFIKQRLSELAQALDNTAPSSSSVSL